MDEKAIGATIIDVECGEDTAVIEYSADGDAYESKINLKNANFAEYLVDERSVQSIDGLIGERVFLRRDKNGNLAVTPNQSICFTADDPKNFPQITVGLGVLLLTLVLTPILLYNSLYIPGAATLILFISSLVFTYKYS